MSDLLNALYFSFKTAGCAFSDNKPSCLANVAKETAASFAPPGLYALSKGCAETFGSLIYAGGREVVSTANDLANRGWALIGKSGEVGLKNKARELAQAMGAQIDKAEMGLLSYLAPNAISTSKSNNSMPFKATSLIGPSLVMYFCGKKTGENVREFFKNFKMLYTGERRQTKYFVTPTGIPFTWSCTKTTSSLLKESLLDVIGGAFWAGAGVLTAVGVRNAMIEGGINETNQANILTAALALMCIAPRVLNVLNVLYNSIASQPKSIPLPESVPIMPTLKKTLGWDPEKQQVVTIDAPLENSHLLVKTK